MSAFGAGDRPPSGRALRERRELVRFAVCAGTLAASSGHASNALACGASVGGTAGVSACSIEEHRSELRARAEQRAGAAPQTEVQAEAPRWRLGASYAFTSTAIRFNDIRLDETRQAVFATGDYRLDSRWTVEIAAGSLIGGHLGAAPSQFDFSPGLLAGGAASARVLDAAGARPFVLLTGQLTLVASSTRESGAADAASVAYRALDLRIGAVAGWNLWHILTPYVLGRVFGGPVDWRYQGSDRTGTDTHHYQLGAGLLVLWRDRVDIFAEGVALGERGASAGAGVLF